MSYDIARFRELNRDGELSRYGVDALIDEVAALRERLAVLTEALETIATLDGLVPMPAAVMTAVAHDALRVDRKEPA